MKIGPKYKIARRLGPEVFEKTQTQKYQLNADKKAKTVRFRRPRSDYGKQLLEKQKIRFTYGVTERQFRNYVRAALSQKKMKPVDYLYESLERRLDNVVYRVGLAPTRSAARQYVSHGHIDVNGGRVTIPSYSVDKGDKLSVRERSRGKVIFQKDDDSDSVESPSWIKFDIKKLEGEIKDYPVLSSKDSVLDFPLVIQFYSR